MFGCCKLCRRKTGAAVPGDSGHARTIYWQWIPRDQACMVVTLFRCSLCSCHGEQREAAETREMNAFANGGQSHREAPGSMSGAASKSKTLLLLLLVLGVSLRTCFTHSHTHTFTICYKCLTPSERVVVHGRATSMPESFTWRISALGADCSAVGRRRSVGCIVVHRQVFMFIP